MKFEYADGKMMVDEFALSVGDTTVINGNEWQTTPPEEGEAREVEHKGHTIRAWALRRSDDPGAAHGFVPFAEIRRPRQ